MLMPLATMNKEEIKPPLFSVITITLNHLRGLQNTHRSLLVQNYTHYEWIVIDGDSNDGTQDYLKNTHTSWISEQDNGIYNAMNKGIARAKGKYILFMNAGDCFASPDILEKIKIEIEKTNPDFIYGDALEISNDGHILKKSRSHRKINQGMFTHHQAMIYSREMLEQGKCPSPRADAHGGFNKSPRAHHFSCVHGVFNENYKIAADYDLTLRIIKKAKNIAYIPTPICLFESGGISQQNALQGRKEQFSTRRQAGIPLWKNASVFIAQSAIYRLRMISPKLYWFLKRG